VFWGDGDVRYARNLRTRLQDVLVHRTCVEHESYSLPGRDQDCSSGTAIPAVEVAEELERCIVVGVIREVEEDVIGLNETRHRTSRRGGMSRGRRILGEMVVG